MASQPAHWLVERNLAVRWTYGLCFVALIVVFPFLPDTGRLLAVRVVSWTSLAAVVVGWRANRNGTRPQRWVRLLVAGLVVVNVALMVELLPGKPVLLAADVLNAIGNVVLFAAAMAAVVARVPGETGGVIDTAILGLAVGGLVWNFGLLPRERAAGAPVVAQLNALLAVFALAGVLGVVVRLRQRSEGRLTPLWVLAAGLVFALAAHITEAVSGQLREYVPASMVVMAAYVCVGLFGLDPVTYQLLQPKPAEKESLSRGRLWFLGTSLAALPVALGVSDAVGGQVNGALLVFGGGLVTVLVMVRIRRLSAERLRAEEALRYLAAHDPLTGLINRRELIARLSKQQGRDAIVLFCDLDKFKDINDRLGHSAGDQLLAEVAHRLTASVRESDIVARLGGDEFLIVLAGAGRAELDAALHRISARLAEPMVLSGQAVEINASIGVVEADGGEPEELLRRADHAMYDAKRSTPVERGIRVVSG